MAGAALRLPGEAGRALGLNFLLPFAGAPLLALTGLLGGGGAALTESRAASWSPFLRPG